MGQILTVGGNDFQAKVLESDIPILVDFWAGWCAPCRRLEPEIDSVARLMAKQVGVAKLNVDLDPEVAARFGVQSIPTLILFDRGSERARMVEPRSSSQIVAAVDSALGHRPTTGLPDKKPLLRRLFHKP